MRSLGYAVILFFIQILSGNSIKGQTINQFSRKDYTYTEERESFDQRQDVQNNWQHRRKTCRVESANLFYADQRVKYDIVSKCWMETQTFPWTYPDVSDLTVKSVGGSVDDGQINKKFFRKDYTYLEETQSFYKIHTLYKTWENAKRTCRMEGATLFYANDKQEFEAVAKFWKEKQRFIWIYVGISDLNAKGIFETVDGVSVTDVFTNWEPEEPNDANSAEDCVTMGRDAGHMNDVDCNRRFPFFCKKTLASLSWNVECEMPYKDYVFNGHFGKCYKFGLIPRNWTDAYSVCGAELSYLAVINSKEEADYLATLTEKTPKYSIYDSSKVLLGFQNRNNDGWTSVKGASLEDTGYSDWHQEQPVDVTEALCGSMCSNGQLDSVKCSEKHYFICEHDLQAGFDNRFGG